MIMKYMRLCKDYDDVLMDGIDKRRFFFHCETSLVESIWSGICTFYYDHRIVIVMIII